MTARRTFAAVAAGLAVAAVPATALAAGRPSSMPPAAYRALVAQGEAMNTRYGNALTRLTPAQYLELLRDGGSKLSPEALNALVARSEAMNDAAAARFHGLAPAAYEALVSEGRALNARYGNALTRLTSTQYLELLRDGGSKLTPQALNALVVRSEQLNHAAAAAAKPPSVATTSSAFAWDDFGFGVAATVGLALLLGGVGVAVRAGRRTGVAARTG
jgi:hypothetical protein